jgi:ParB family transcriptional regulator, chromosome partitioning protein
MPETKAIALSDIAVAIHRLRALRPDKVDALAQSMTDQGLLQPIVVRSHEGGGYLLVAGLHRFEAAKKLKWKTISCTVFDDMETDEAELVEIDENLVRADLSPAERALQIGRRQELYEKKHGKAKALGGHASQAAQGHKANANLADAFTKDATKKTRQSERSVQRDATRAKKVAVLPDIAGTSLDKGGRSIKPGAEEVPKWSMWLITSGRLLFTQ